MSIWDSWLILLLVLSQHDWKISYKGYIKNNPARDELVSFAVWNRKLIQNLAMLIDNVYIFSLYDSAKIVKVNARP